MDLTRARHLRAGLHHRSRCHQSEAEGRPAGPRDRTGTRAAPTVPCGPRAWPGPILRAVDGAVHHRTVTRVRAALKDLLGPLGRPATSDLRGASPWVIARHRRETHGPTRAPPDRRTERT